MQSGTRVVKNTLILTTLRVAMPIFSLTLVLAISRFLGAEGLGRYTLIFGFFNFFITLTPLGLNTFLMREGARDLKGLPSLLGNAALLGMVSSLVMMPIMSGLGGWLGYDTMTRWSLILLSLAILPASLLTFFEAIFVACERTEYIAISSLIEHVMKIGLAIALLKLDYGLHAVVITFVGSNMLACLISWRLLHKIHVPLRWAVDRSVLRRLVEAAPTFLLISLFAVLYWRIDVFMLSLLRPLTDVGYYGAAYRIMEIMKIVPQSLCMALYPQMAHAAVAEPQELERL